MTHATFLWLGQAIGAAALSILQTLTTGAIALTNIVFDASQGTPTVYVGSQITMHPLASGLSFVTNGTQSGVVLKDNGITANATYTVTCTGTGGNVKVTGGAKYDTCIIPPQLSSTGAITRIALMVAKNPAASHLSCSFVKGRNSGTGTSFTNFNQLTSASGSIALFGSGSLRWNSADFIKCGTLTNPTSGFSANLKVDYFDDTSE